MTNAVYILCMLSSLLKHITTEVVLCTDFTLFTKLGKLKTNKAVDQDFYALGVIRWV